VVGVDPSISSTGVAFLSDCNEVHDRIQSKPNGESLAARLDRLRRQAVTTVHSVERAAWASGASIAMVVIEGPAYGSNNQMTHMLAGFWWLLVHGLEQLAPVAVVQPSTLKKFATGNGRAGKDEMLAAAIAAFPRGDIRNNDVADAAALAAMGAVHLGIEFGGGFASSGRASVQAVRWPELKGERP
jgi:Holliday junction resolvasome RuvABC endonuclease subunit